MSVSVLKREALLLEITFNLETDLLTINTVIIWKLPMVLTRLDIVRIDVLKNLFMYE